MIVEIVKVDGPKSEAGKGGKAYQIIEVAYKDEAGRIQGKKLVSFQNPTVFDAFSKAQSGERFDVTSEKVGNFWNWTGVGPAGAAASVPTGSKPTSGGKVIGNNYETAEERKEKQRVITKLAVLNTAVAFLTATGDKKASKETVVESAEFFEKWVIDKPSAIKALASIEEDIPY
jgi:hypothetical protein